MVAFVDGPVRVSVPATSANLGPGFDSLGLALSLRDRVEAEVVARGLEIEVSGPDAVPLDESHLVVRSMRAAFDVLGEANVIPHARGLGSSSAAIVAGVALARALVAGGSLVVDDDALFRLAARLEGHPDNVAPAFYGGFVISGSEDGEFYAVRSTVDPRVTAVVFVPPAGVETTVARGLLPEQVAHADAAANSGRTALLVAALAGQPEHLLRATRDYLHQDYREPAMPDSLALVRSLRGDGIPAIVSGAGPTVLAFTNGPASVAPSTLQSPKSLLRRAPAGWAAHHLSVDRDGVLLA